MASVSDQNGNLLLFSDGVRLWWRNNATGNIVLITNQLRGHNSSAQNVIFIPRPGYPNRYFIVTISGATTNINFSKGLYFSEVDATNGSIVSAGGNPVLNVALSTKVDIFNNLLNPIPIDQTFGNLSEAFTSTVHSNGSDYWLVAQVENQSYGLIMSYKIDCNGFSSNRQPVKQSLYTIGGMAHMLKISPTNIAANTRRIAMTKSFIDGTNFGTFNILDGTINLTTANVIVPSIAQQAKYGLEFSPNSNLLYISGETLDCYDFTLNTLVFQNTLYGGETGLQLGIDNKIYSASGYIINSPNIASIANITTGTPFNGSLCLPQWVHWQQMPSTSLIANDDGPINVNSATGQNTQSVILNDTNNGSFLSNLTNYTLSEVGGGVTPVPAVGSIAINTSTGVITIAAGTSCGTYKLKYSICNKQDCRSCSNVATVTIVVGNANSLPLTATKDTVCLIPGSSSNVSILSNDTVNGLSANGSNVSITTIGSIPSGISVNANGFVTVSSGTVAGNYTFSYKICNLCNPSNCSNATNVSVNVYSTTLRANNDIVFSDSTGAIRGGGYNVLSNDYNLCSFVNPNTVTILTSENPNFSINTTSGANFGNVTVNPNLPTGNYSLTYQICEISNPTSCSSATVTLTVGLTLGSRADNTVRTTNLYGVNNDVIITGDFTSYNGIVRNKIAKLKNNNLSLNTSFGSVINFGPSHPILTTNLIKTVFVDGNVIYVGGDFTNFNNTAKNRIAKLDGDTGNLISVFDARFNNTVYDIKKQGNKLIVVGDFLYRDATGLRRKGIARIDPITGAIDSSFLINLPGTDGAINAVEFLSDGNMIIAGNFSYYNNVLVNGIAKINPDGNLITSFNAGGTRFNITTPGNNKIVEKMLVRGNSIYIAGFFANYNGVPVGNIVKLSTVTGAIDSIFNNTTVGANAPIFSMISESGTNDSGTLLLGGYFSSYNTPLNNIPYLIRINNNGSLNTSLVGNINISGPASLGGSVFSMVQQPDGKLIFGGNFTSVNSIPANRITRLNTSTGVQAKMTDNENLSNNTIENEVNIYPNPSKGIFTIYFVEKMENENNISVYNMLGQKILDYLVSEIETFDLNLSNYANGTYFVKISNGLKTITKKVIKQ